jgi:hypothetical protein
MRKTFSMFMVIAMVLSMSTVAFAVTNVNIANSNTKPQAIKSISTIYINDKPVQFEIYTVGSKEYYKLRDLAKALNGTENQFDIEYIQAKDTVRITTNKPYKEVGGELQFTNSPEVINIDNSSWDKLYKNCYIDGKDIQGIMYINGSAHIGYRDLSDYLGFRQDYWFDYVDYKFIRTRQKPVDNYNTTMTQPYTFSQTKLDYPYNIYIENKGYMNFGTAKPFMENGALYLPVKHMTYLGNYYDYTFDTTTNSVILSNDYTEKDLYEGKSVKEVQEHIVRYNNGSKEVWENDGGAVGHVYRKEFILNVNSSILTTKKHNKLTDWGREFLESGGCWVTQRPGTTYWYLNSGGFDGKGLKGGKLDPEIESFNNEHKVIIKNGEPYWERSVLSSLAGTTMLTSEHEKTLYYGSDEYLEKLLQEVVNPNLKMDDSFNNGKTYMETMDDLFKDIPPYTPPKN